MGRSRPGSGALCAGLCAPPSLCARTACDHGTRERGGHGSCCRRCSCEVAHGACGRLITTPVPHQARFTMIIRECEVQSGGSGDLRDAIGNTAFRGRSVAAGGCGRRKCKCLCEMMVTLAPETCCCAGRPWATTRRLFICRRCRYTPGDSRGAASPNPPHTQARHQHSTGASRPRPGHTVRPAGRAAARRRHVSDRSIPQEALLRRAHWRK